MFVNHEAASFFRNGSHCHIQLLAAVTAERPKDLAGETLRMNAHQRRVLSQITQHNRKCGFDLPVAVRVFALEPQRLKQSPPGRHSCGDNALNLSSLCSSYHDSPK